MKRFLATTLLSCAVVTGFSGISFADTPTNQDIYEVITPDGTDTYNLVDVIGAMGTGARFYDQTKEYIAEFPNVTIRIPLMPTDKVYINNNVVQLGRPVITNFVGQQAVILAPKEMFDRANLTISKTQKIDLHALEQVRTQAQPINMQQAVLTSTASNPVIVINGRPLSLDVSPVIIEGHILVPLRAIFEGLNGTVNWDDNTRTVDGALGNSTVNLVIDDLNATVNGINSTLDVPAQIMDGHTMVPLRFISEALGAQVNWDSTNNVVTIKK